MNLSKFAVARELPGARSGALAWAPLAPMLPTDFMKVVTYIVVYPDGFELISEAQALDTAAGDLGASLEQLHKLGEHPMKAYVLFEYRIGDIQFASLRSVLTVIERHALDHIRRVYAVDEITEVTEAMMKEAQVIDKVAGDTGPPLEALKHLAEPL